MLLVGLKKQARNRILLFQSRYEGLKKNTSMVQTIFYPLRKKINFKINKFPNPITDKKLIK